MAPHHSSARQHTATKPWPREAVPRLWCSPSLGNPATTGFRRRHPASLNMVRLSRSVGGSPGLTGLADGYRSGVQDPDGSLGRCSVIVPRVR